MNNLIQRLKRWLHKLTKEVQPPEHPAVEALKCGLHVCEGYDLDRIVMTNKNGKWSVEATTVLPPSIDTIYVQFKCEKTSVVGSLPGTESDE